VPIECAWANARIVTPDEIFVGSVLSRDGVIASVDRGSSVPAGASDLGGDYLLPGRVELHTDNVEKHVKPRPGIVWPSIQAALIAHDRQVVSAGLTTVFDALGCGAIEENPVRQKLLTDLVNGIRQAEGAGTLRAEHLVHLRCELCDPNMRNSFDEIVMDPAVRLVSVMDHSPGQRQYKDAMSLRRAMGWNEEAHAHAQIATLMHASAEIAPPMRRHVAQVARARGIVLASHDDSTEAHIEEAVQLGISIAEFPTTRVAAETARRAGMRTLLGAPNVVRGGSHTGNVSVAALAAEGFVDALSSDYYPSSLLEAAFVLHRKGGLSLGAAVGAASENPARMVGLGDRGRIAADQRADLLRVREFDGFPVVLRVWRAGRRVF